MFNVNTKTIFTASTKKITNDFASKTGVFTSGYTPFVTTTSMGISYGESSIISGGLGAATLPLPSIVLQATSPLFRPTQTIVSACEDYLELASLAETINEYLMLFSSGNMQGLASGIDIDVYTTLSLALSHVKKLDDISYKTLYRTVEYSLAGLYQAVLQFNSFVDIKRNYETSMEKSKILDNLELLRVYLESLRGVRSLFGTFNITTVLAKVKPQYARYIELYGFPESSVFEPSKLAECVEYTKLHPEYGIDTTTI